MESGFQILRLAPQPSGNVLRCQLRVLIEHQRRQPACPFQQRGIGGEIGKAQQRST